MQKLISILLRYKIISDISYKCDFSTPEYFGKVYKKYKNYSPTSYRKPRVYFDKNIKFCNDLVTFIDLNMFI